METKIKKLPKGRILKLIILTVLLFWTLFPIYWMVSLAIRKNTEFSGVLSIIPKSFTLDSLINMPFIIWFMISFFENLPEELEESAEVDGATEFQIFTKIVLPLVLPGMAAITILSFMTSWNEYLYGAIFVQSPSNFTIFQNSFRSNRKFSCTSKNYSLVRN